MNVALQPVASEIIDSKVSGPVLQKKPETKRLNALTSLRFFAAMLIVFLHFSFEICPKALQFVINIHLEQGVSFFFVLSGFIMAYVYPELNGWTNVARFFRARLARIYPCHLLGLGLWLLIVPNALPLKKFLQLLAANLLLVQDWIQRQSFFFSFNAPSWSLSCELFFYLSFPFLIYHFAKTWKQKLFGCALFVPALIIAALCLKTPMKDNSVYGAWFYITSPLPRIFEFCLGMSTALLFSQVRHAFKLNTLQTTVVEIMLVTAALLFILIPEHAPPALSFLQETRTWVWIGSSGGAPIYAAMLLVFALEKGWLSRLLARPFPVLLGEISYSIYLLHFPLLRFICLHGPELKSVSSAWLYAGFWMCTMVASYLCFELIEKPMRGFIMGHGLSHVPKKLSPALIGNLICLCTLMGLTSLAISGHGFSLHPINEKAAAELAHQSPKEVPGTTFGGKYELMACALVPQTNGYDLTLVWRGHRLQFSKYNVAIHDMDAHGKIVINQDYTQDPRWTYPGQMWVDRVPITNKQWHEIKQIGIGIYTLQPVKMLFINHGSNLGNYRLMISARDLESASKLAFTNN